jgi:hypothetical protein
MKRLLLTAALIAGLIGTAAAIPPDQLDPRNDGITPRPNPDLIRDIKYHPWNNFVAKAPLVKPPKLPLLTGPAINPNVFKTNPPPVGPAPTRIVPHRR